LIVKTGTANQYQSIVALAASRRFTCAVWMGNFSGETVMGKTGSSIPAAIARNSLVFLHRNFTAEIGAIDFDEPEAFVKTPVCAVSGLAPTEACAAVLYEYADRPLAPCTWHRMENGAPGINYPAEYQSWLIASKREGAAGQTGSELAIVTPRDGFVFFTAAAPNQAVPVEVIGGAFDELRVFYDGAEWIERRPFKFFLPLAPGEHTLTVNCGSESREVSFTVDPPPTSGFTYAPR
jgi:penicillin-binding protein 1C